MPFLLWGGLGYGELKWLPEPRGSPGVTGTGSSAPRSQPWLTPAFLPRAAMLRLERSFCKNYKTWDDSICNAQRWCLFAVSGYCLHSALSCHFANSASPALKSIKNFNKEKQINSTLLLFFKEIFVCQDIVPEGDSIRNWNS